MSNNNEYQQNNPQDSSNKDLVDIGLIFHEHGSNLLAVLQVIKRAIETLGPTPFKSQGEPTPNEIDDLLVEPVKALTASVKQLIDAVNGDFEKRGIPENVLHSFSKRYEQLVNYRIVGQGTFRPPFLYGIAKSLLDLLSKLDGAALPKEKVKNLKKHSKEVQRLICLYDLTIGKSRIISMDNQTQSLLGHLTGSLRSKEARRIVQVQDLIIPVVNSLEEYSKNRRVEVRMELEACKARVEVDEADVRRALRNILQNAIKYSGQLQSPQLAWVIVRCSGEDRYTCIQFENWGVPIMKDEIEKGSIFKSGYRGVYASAEGRTGSGLGLHEAMQIAKEHNGEITVESLPAREPASYKQPFITTVTFKLLRHTR